MKPSSLPLVCLATLESLEESLDGEQALCQRFVSTYVDMWPGRFVRIFEAVSAGHSEHAMDAVLSLRSSCKMIGAVRLGELADDLVNDLNAGCMAAATKHLKALRKCGNETAWQLTSSYAQVA
ncbi:hypothetical protein ACX80D_03030 [Arthrobacter sp. Sr24]